MTAIVDIWNMALAHVGHSTPVSDPNTETTTAANLCRTFYATSRDQVLREGRFNFATARATLALLPDTVTNWQFAYAYPTDCLDARALVLPGQRDILPRERVPFEVAVLGGQKVILTDLDDAELVYTARVENPNLWDPTAVMALSYLLAANIGVPLTGKPDVAQAARNAYLVMASQASAQSLNEAQGGPEPECEFIKVRF